MSIVKFVGLLYKSNHLNLVVVSPGVAITKVVYNLYFTDINKTKINNIKTQYLNPLNPHKLFIDDQEQ